MKLNNEIILTGILALIGTFLAGGWIEENYYPDNVYVVYAQLPPPNPHGLNVPETKIEKQTETGDEIPVENVVFQLRPIAPKEFDEQIRIPMEVPENKGVNLPPVPSFQPPPPLYELFFEKAKKDLRMREIIDGREYNVTGMQIVEEKGDGRLNN